MSTNTSKPKDGAHVLADPVSRRTVAYGFLSALVLPFAFSVLPAALWGRLAALMVAAATLSAIALVVAVHLIRRAEELAAMRDKTIRIERAAAKASRALLKRDVVDPVGSALSALIEGVEVASVFLETNTNEPLDQHKNMPTVRDILHSRTSIDNPGRWELTGWRVGPEARDALGSGLAFATAITALDSLTIACYRASNIGSEVLVPITAEGRWVGSIGFTSRDRRRYWASEEKQLLRSTAEMIGAYWERRDAKGKLEELLAAKDEFIASVSHEVRTPLTAVLGFASELDDHIEKFSEDERSDLIGLIASQSREVANIVDDLLTAARAEAGTLVIAPQILSARDVVGEVLSSHSGRVDFAMHSDLEIWADGGRVRQILRNLLTNAERYGGSIVKMSVRQADETVRIEVRDNGEGIPVHLRDHVFEPYARAKGGSVQPASVGLGLSVARRLAQMMDGELELSAEDDWTVFSLSLPAAAAVGASTQPALAH